MKIIKIKQSEIKNLVERIVKEKNIENKPLIKEANNPKIEKMVNHVNELIAKAVDDTGDPVGITDPTLTIEEPYIYEPIRYSNGTLRISSYSMYDTQRKTTDIIKAKDMEFEGIPTLRFLARRYKVVIKKLEQGKYWKEDPIDEKYLRENNGLVALKSIIKKMINENEVGNETETSEWVVVHKRQREYGDKVYIYNPKTKEIRNEFLRHGYGSNDETKMYGEYNPQFVKENEQEIKNAIIKLYFENHGPDYYTKVSNWFPQEFPNLLVNVKGSRKYKGKTAELIWTREQYNSFSHRDETIAKIKGEDGKYYFISTNTLRFPEDVAKNYIMKYFTASDSDVFDLIFTHENGLAFKK